MLLTMPCDGRSFPLNRRIDLVPKVPAYIRPGQKEPETGEMYYWPTYAE
jgi:hypothetical protein